jgi:NADPH-dependent 2,4-dienoyl-CoA reductase/sulfur reductase-like enzyme
MKEYDVIIIGGGPAGVVSAITARRYYPKIKILLIKDIEKGVIPCGIPYMFSTLEKPEDNIMGNLPLEKNNIEFKIDEITKIDKKNKEITTKNRFNYKYKKLIIATGSKPIIPKIQGIEKKGVYTIIKEMNYLKNLKEFIKQSKNIIIVGGGFIGIEFAEELSKFKDKTINIIELSPGILFNSFDLEFSEKVTEELTKKGIKIHTNVKLKKINGKEKVESVLLSNQKTIPADIVIFGIGSTPNTSLAESSKIKTNKNGIIVNDFLKTSDKNIFAVGDCSEKKDFFTKHSVSVMLASTATTQARIAGCNLFKKFVRKDIGTIASYSTKIGDLVLSSTGMTEKTAKEKGFKIITGTAESWDKHPEKLPNSSKIKVKLVFSNSGILLGGQVMGSESAGEVINVISTAIQKKFHLCEIEDLQIATHPKLTPAPTTYPIINAAQDALQHLKLQKNKK